MPLNQSCVLLATLVNWLKAILGLFILQWIIGALTDHLDNLKNENIKILSKLQNPNISISVHSLTHVSLKDI